MARKTLYNCAFLKVEIERPFLYKREVEREDWLRLAKDLKESIERHCDSFSSISIEHDTEDICEFCGASWTEDGDVDNGGCCSADVKEGGTQNICFSCGLHPQECRCPSLSQE
jgi:hypothetical protein